MEPLTTAKTTWWLASKVTWAFSWRYLLYVLPACFIGGILAGVLVNFIGLLTGTSGSAGITLLSVVSGVLVAVFFIINFFRIMLNKGEFKSFSFLPKTGNPNA